MVGGAPWWRVVQQHPELVTRDPRYGKPGHERGHKSPRETDEQGCYNRRLSFTGNVKTRLTQVLH